VAHVYVLGTHTELYNRIETQLLDNPYITFIILALSTFRLSRLFTTDVIFDALRQRVWKRFPPSTTLGYFFTCDWCMSIWFGSLIVISYTIIPTVTLICALPLALSAVAGILAARV